MSKTETVTTTNWNAIPYPKEEDAMCAALVKEMGANNSWDDKVQAWTSLLAVRAHAKIMRDERQISERIAQCQNQ